MPAEFSEDQMAKLRFEARPEGDATMAPEMVDAVNYYAWILEQLRPHLGRQILDIGGGFGSHLEPLVKEGQNIFSIDLSEASVQVMQDRFKDYPNFEAHPLDFGSVDGQSQLVVHHFDTIMCLNVLEHIEDDLGALKHMYTILEAQQGTLLLQVPAHPWLYGSLDALAGHYRRYNRTTLRAVLTQAGFDVKRLYYFNSFGVLPWFINARILKPRALATRGVGTQIKIFDRYIVPVIRQVEDLIRLPFGQSLIAVAAATGVQTC